MAAAAIPEDRRRRPGGRSARVRSAVLAAAAELLAEGGYDRVEIPEVARRAGVHPTTVYRRWASKGRLVGEAILERSRTLTPTPDTGSVESDLQRLVLDGAAQVHTPEVRALFEVLLAQATTPTPEVAAARDRFWDAHRAEAAGVVQRAVGRSELPPGTDPGALIDLVVGPALVRSILMGQELGEVDARKIVARAITSLRDRPGGA